MTGIGVDGSSRLAALAESSPWSIGELASLAAELLGETAQGGRVTSERTVRYYVTRGVVSAAAGRGASSRWGYGHLVEVLAARLGQRSGDDLNDVAGRRSKMNPADLERWVLDRLPQPVSRPPPAVMPRHSSWLRFAVVDGVELAIADTHPLAGEPGRVAGLLEALAREVGDNREE